MLRIGNLILTNERIVFLLLDVNLYKVKVFLTDNFTKKLYFCTVYFILKMKNHIRLQEYQVLLYRLLLVYLFYFLSRLFFAFFNWKLLEIDSFWELLRLAYYGLPFDTTAIIYSNGLFMLLSILPLYVNTRKGYQKFLFYLYFITNLITISFNFIDFIYYKFTFGRSSINILESIENEQNKSTLGFNFLVNYWYVFVLFFAMAWLWIYLYKKVRVDYIRGQHPIKYSISSLLGIIVIGVIGVGGARGGDFKKTTRPINLVDANKHVKKAVHADIVLNTPFCIMRTIGKTSFKKVNLVSEDVIQQQVKPIKQYTGNPKSRPNVVVFIMESFGREYIGAFNKNSPIENYESFTPFLDSLAQHSYIFTNAYANGYKSIHGMSSILAGIPSFKDAFTSSPYPNQNIESLVSILKSEGYDTSFFHGAPNGSMGFSGFAQILGFDHYYGKTEYNNDADFDGTWAIWDEPFFKFMGRVLDEKKEPFFAAHFTTSSHEPYNIPRQYEGKFPKGYVPIHKCIGYSDNALREFFNQIKKSDWYENTIFIITADHCNQVYYDYYTKILNKRAVPILIFSPDGKFIGENNDFAQHIDIYPTIMDIIGYEKPFRSWGRSLFSEKEEPFLISYANNNYFFGKGNYICAFDGKNAVGFYDKDDVGLEVNLIGKRNQEMNDLELACKAFVQDYFNRIIDKRLTSQN